MLAVHLVGVVSQDNVRVRKLGGGLDFLTEATDRLRMGDDLVTDQLQGHRAGRGRQVRRGSGEDRGKEPPSGHNGRFGQNPLTIEDLIRITNRLGGGMNPAMIVLFFLLAGVAYRHRRWIEYAVAMSIAGLGGGILAQLVKFAVGRTRPELWLGPFAHARASSTSFPSGHTVGAFALAGVIVFASRNLPLRIVAIIIAFAVGVSRILAFRHWTSDVLASALIGVAVAWATTRSVIAVTNDIDARS